MWPSALIIGAVAAAEEAVELFPAQAEQENERETHETDGGDTRDPVVGLVFRRSQGLNRGWAMY